MNSNKLYKLIISALMIAMGVICVTLLGGVQVLGQGISPLHIPALICGLACGPVFGAAAGALIPIVCTLITGRPPFPAVALPMVFELAAYGLLSGLLYPLFVKLLKLKVRTPGMVLAMLAAMAAGRLVGGAAKAIFMGIQGNAWSFNAFLTAYFAATAIGAVIHLIVVPAIVSALEAAKLSPLAREKFGK